MLYVQAKRKETSMKVTKLKRLNNTKNGNPQWDVFTTEGVHRTKPDAQVGHEIQNWEGREVWLTIDGDGYILAVGPR
jgi:hypothetical protein